METTIRERPFDFYWDGGERAGWKMFGPGSFFHSQRGPVLLLVYMYNKIRTIAQQAHDVRMTSDRRRCDVMTSHRR